MDTTKIQNLKHSIPMVYHYTISARRQNVFDQICNLENIYSEMSPAHELFKVRGGGELNSTSVIDCEETVDGEHVKHVYVMEEFIQNEFIYYISDSVTTLPSGMKAKSKVHCYFKLNDSKENGTDVEMAVIIQFSNSINKLFGKLFGTEKVWRPHQVEENLNLARIIESNYPKN